MGTLIIPWHGDHDKRSNLSQLVPTEFKSDPSYVKHTVGHMAETLSDSQVHSLAKSTGSFPKFEVRFGTVRGKLMLFNIIEKKGR